MDRQIEKIRNNRGITIIEIIIVIVIISMLMFVFIEYMRTFMYKNRLDNAVTLTISLLEETKRKSTTSGIMHGIDISSESRIIKLFRVEPSSSSCSSNTIISTITLPDGILFKSENVIAFDRNGYPRNASCGLGMEKIVLEAVAISDNPTAKKSICINRYGRVRVIIGEVCPDE